MRHGRGLRALGGASSANVGAREGRDPRQCDRKAADLAERQRLRVDDHTSGRVADPNLTTAASLADQLSEQASDDRHRYRLAKMALGELTSDDRRVAAVAAFQRQVLELVHRRTPRP